MDSYPLIVYRDSPLGRRPMLGGSRLDVVQVVETVRNEGGDVEAAAEYLSLTPTQVRACVRFYADNRDEVSEYAARVAAENDHLRAASERERVAMP